MTTIIYHGHKAHTHVCLPLLGSDATVPSSLFINKVVKQNRAAFALLFTFSVALSSNMMDPVFG